jgi:DNA-binding CsgD family transcriptional regulator
VTAGEEELRRGRQRFAERAWREANDALERADLQLVLEGADLERLAVAAYMLGDEHRYLELLERAHDASLGSGDQATALRCAFWASVQFAQRGEMAQAGGWLRRAEQLADELGAERPERGYLLFPRMFELESRGEFEQAASVAGEAVEIGRRHGDRDLYSLAAHAQGHMLVEAGRVREGLALLDEAMLVASREELSPIVTGLVYCGVVLACQQAYEVGRAREWTAALSRWCEEQPDLVAFSGRCLVHRAEIKQLEGSWEDAIAETRRAEERSLAGGNRLAAAEAVYRRAELHRLRGEDAAAEREYRQASLRGREPQPGMALWRLGRGETSAASAAIKRALAELADVPTRLQLLAAAVEIMLADGDLDGARGACDQLESLVEADECPALVATLARARGQASLAAGEPGEALASLRGAAAVWQRLGTPYEHARTRELIGLGCRALGDEDGAALELEAARTTFEELGAKPDLARLEARGAPSAARDSHGLTRRELEVLRLLAAGRTNRAIADELVLSERTIDRHVSNIFAKLGVSSRAAATAYAYEHGLVGGSTQP